jgi:mannosyltransferase
MSTAAIERHTLRTAITVGPPVVLAGLTTLLFARLLPDVSGLPLHEDEAVAGLISARPLGEVLQTVVIDRGGAPLHFVLAHVALAVDPSAQTLRWLSVVFALGTIPLCYDLARRLSGPLAGLIAAALAATSQLLTVYGTFGRMYSLFTFASVLAADLFVRAVDRPTQKSALAAAASSLLPLAVHPFGVFLFSAEVVVACLVWRGRSIRAALPAIAVALGALPLVLTNLRLSDRYAPEAGYPTSEAVLRALGGAAGGGGFVLAAFTVAAAAGALILARRRPAIAALAVLTLVVPPAVLTLAAEAGFVADRFGPRHFLFLLPVWIGLVATGLNGLARPLAVAAVILLVTLAPEAVPGPRTFSSGAQAAVTTPAAWLQDRLSPGDVLYPYSPVFLAALPGAARATGYPREPVALARAAQRTHDVPALFVALPTRDSWLILEGRGPYRDGRAVLRAAVQLLRDAPRTPYAEQIRSTACKALRRLKTNCV